MLMHMATRTRAIDEALRRWWSTSRAIGEELRRARRMIGITQARVGEAVAVSQSEISRRESGKARRFTAEQIAVHAAVVGLRLSIKLWPAGGALRDETQARYIAEFLRRVGHAWRVMLEAPIPISGDLRAIDVLLRSGDVRIAVEVITRLTDLQAQVRAAQLKARDVQATRLILVVAGTRSNRDALAAARPSLVDAFDTDTRRILGQLARGTDPGRNGIVVL
jgi:transcriptional regulator with XRE-family HTH domain